MYEMLTHPLSLFSSCPLYLFHTSHLFILPPSYLPFHRTSVSFLWPSIYSPSFLPPDSLLTWTLSRCPLPSIFSTLRCNVQDYIWHKGSRCESVVTEFQVMCLAVGASALVVLLLFMIIVCFAKKLHVLKTENKKLRKRRWAESDSFTSKSGSS